MQIKRSLRGELFDVYAFHTLYTDALRNNCDFGISALLLALSMKQLAWDDFFKNAQYDVFESQVQNFLQHAQEIRAKLQ